MSKNTGKEAPFRERGHFRFDPSLLSFVVAALLVGTAAGQSKGTGVSGSPQPAKGLPYRKVHVLLVGVNRYQSPGVPNLRYAESDVAEVRRVLSERYGIAIPDSSVLLGREATRANIFSHLDSLADSNLVKQGDAVIVYFSMHGQSIPASGGGMLGFLIPQDAQVLLKDRNPAPYHRTAVSMQAVWERLDTSPARHVIVIADACFSGLLVADRGEPVASPAGDFLALNYGRTGREALVAGSALQTTKEDDGRKHGRFTYALLEELENRAALGKTFVSIDLVPVLKASATFGTEQSPEYGKRDGAAGCFTFTPLHSPAAPIEPIADPVRSTPSNPVTEVEKTDGPTLLGNGASSSALLALDSIVRVSFTTEQSAGGWKPNPIQMPYPQAVELPAWAVEDVLYTYEAQNCYDALWLACGPAALRNRTNLERLLFDSWLRNGRRFERLATTVHFTESQALSDADRVDLAKVYGVHRAEVKSLRSEFERLSRDIQKIKDTVADWRQRRIHRKEADELEKSQRIAAAGALDRYVGTFDIASRLTDLSSTTLGEVKIELSLLGIDCEVLKQDVSKMLERIAAVR